MPQAKRLAITIAGAVSLGSYEAGVLYEVIQAIGSHNAGKTASDPNRIEIDVITGASAGAITATVAVQKLMYEKGALAKANDNALYNPWVKDAVLDDFLKLQAGDNPTVSILSSDYMEGISQKYITQRYAAHLTAPSEKHPAAADTIRLGLALSNLNGVDYSRPTNSGGSFTYTKYQDQIIHSFTPADDKKDIWETFRKAAVASGAFPFAFRPQELHRLEIEYKSSQYLVPWTFSSKSFTYTDGGVFQNEPLGMAKSLVDEIDDHRNNDSRFYLFVAPGSRGSTSSSEFNLDKANFAGMAKQLATCVFQQARFHDWIQAEEINDKIKVFNTRAMELHAGFLSYLTHPRPAYVIDPTVLAPAAKLLLPPLFGNDLAKQGAAWGRLKSQFESEYDQLVTANNNNSSVADTWIDSILAFETAADLGDSDEMVIYDMTSAETDLASARLEAFQGFFDFLYRDHDYNVGRAKARLVLKALHSGLGPLDNYPADIIPTPNPELNNLDMKYVDREERQRVKDRLTQNAHSFMEEIGIPTSLIREAIDLAFISPELRRLLAL